ncbi:hypothetical protein JZO66_10250 [Enterococcus sp. DIV0242_7C1]|uniref:Uncharacterized protein n=1 Tax=Candidatus Enterococcus dunnyi TaxID=1834192 RepID=A0A200J9V8_9ENTE|nr:MULTISPECIES: hypothetical protein [unclassified Enterococcus]MBO0470927.1 hypothetical protein [Enterococcus sp. DIV0242_7C1]MCA5013163.1 hypothetical protein [Enterococcus sp. S23]MCA5016413.1 hypothetical protein [Enterococcus sp. S22(2020)]OUZ33375.1 hypothetical protein A5889_002088 [Enterococcus sp. 9D6_DIV0238]
MKINGAALVGLLFLDLILVGFGIALIALIFSLWVVVYSFIASPFLVIGAHFLQLQEFTLWRIVLGAILAALSFTVILPFAKTATSKVKALFIQYFAFHQQSLYK